MDTPMYSFLVKYHDKQKGKRVTLPIMQAPNVGVVWAALLNSQLDFDEVEIKQLGPAPRAVYLRGEQHVAS